MTDGTLDMERVDESTIVFHLLSIGEGGIRFSLHRFLRVVLCHWGLIPSQPNVNFFRIVMGIIELNCRLRINLSIPVIWHCYALAKSFGRHGHYFLRAKDTNHQLVTMLSSSGKRVDDVMVVVRGNWEFGEGEDHLDPIPRRRGEPGGRIASCVYFSYIYKTSFLRSHGFACAENDLKKVLTSTDDAVLLKIKVALKYFGCPSLQKQGRAAHVLLRYQPTYTTFSAAENIPIPMGEEFLMSLILTDFKNLRQVGFKGSDSERAEVAEVVESGQSEVEVDEALKLAFEEAGLNLANPPSTSGRGDLPFDDIFIGLEDLSGAYPKDMARLSLTQLAKKKNTERMATRRRAEVIRSEVPPAVEAQPSLPVTKEEMAQTGIVESEAVVQANQEAEWTEKRPAEVEAGFEENCADKWPRLEESDVIVPFVTKDKKHADLL